MEDEDQGTSPRIDVPTVSVMLPTNLLRALAQTQYWLREIDTRLGTMLHEATGAEQAYQHWRAGNPYVSALTCARANEETAQSIFRKVTQQVMPLLRRIADAAVPEAAPETEGPTMGLVKAFEVQPDEFIEHEGLVYKVISREQTEMLDGAVVFEFRIESPGREVGRRIVALFDGAMKRVPEPEQKARFVPLWQQQHSAGLTRDELITKLSGHLNEPIDAERVVILGQGAPAEGLITDDEVAFLA